MSLLKTISSKYPTAIAAYPVKNQKGRKNPAFAFADSYITKQVLFDFSKK